MAPSNPFKKLLPNRKKDKEDETDSSGTEEAVDVALEDGKMQQVDPDRSVLYINIFILDAKDAVEAKVARSVANKPAPIRKLAPMIAKDVASTTMVASKMITKLCAKIPTRMKAKGIDAVVEPVYHKKSYIVLQLQVQAVNSLLLAQQQPPNLLALYLARVLEYVLKLIGETHQQTLEQDYLPDLVQSKLEVALDDLLSTKLAEKGLEATAKVLPEAQQARYFFTQVPYKPRTPNKIVQAIQGQLPQVPDSDDDED